MNYYQGGEMPKGFQKCVLLIVYISPGVVSGIVKLSAILMSVYSLTDL